MTKRVIVALLATIGLVLGVGVSAAQATALPDTWTNAQSALDGNNYSIVCEVKWRGHSGGTDNWTPIAFNVVADGPNIFQTTLSHYADPSYTQYGTWGPYVSATGYHNYSSYITADGKYDDKSSSYVVFHFVTGTGDYPCGVRPPDLL